MEMNIELEIGKVYYFDLSTKTKGVFVFKDDSSDYFAPIGDKGKYIISSKHKGLIGFPSDCFFIECKI